MIGNFVFGVLALGANAIVWGGIGAFLGFVFAALRHGKPIGILAAFYMLLTISGPGLLLALFVNWLHKGSWVFTPVTLSSIGPLVLGCVAASIMGKEEM